MRLGRKSQLRRGSRAGNGNRWEGLASAQCCMIRNRNSPRSASLRGLTKCVARGGFK